jgi:hypothetical protein
MSGPVPGPTSGRRLTRIGAADRLLETFYFILYKDEILLSKGSIGHLASVSRSSYPRNGILDELGFREYSDRFRTMILLSSRALTRRRRLSAILM